LLTRFFYSKCAEISHRHNHRTTHTRELLLLTCGRPLLSFRSLERYYGEEYKSSVFDLVQYIYSIYIIYFRSRQIKKYKKKVKPTRVTHSHCRTRAHTHKQKAARL